MVQLNYELALALMYEEPGASINKSDAILYHLERSFVSSDKRYQARFWYARQLCLTNNYDKAKSLFEKLRGLPRPLSVKSEVKGVVKNDDGSNKMFYGQIYALKDTFGFIRSDAPEIELYFSTKQMPEGINLQQGQRVVFEIGFRLMGPIALNVQPLLI